MLNDIKIPEHWQKPLLTLMVMLVLFVGVFFDSWNSIVSIWSRSETFAHGFLIAPGSLWLIWTGVDRYKNMCPRFSYFGLLGFVVCGFVWLCAELSHVLVVEQFALVGMLVCLAWSVLGNQVTACMLFPLFFLFLMVPFGEDFVPFLMEYTASFVVGMLRLTGISVFREGLHFTLTSGQWSVVEACSGIRYLIASITLGLVYAYLNYVSHFKRAIFILASVLVPILANGLRAYMIVMIGHLSSMKLATGVDHIIYGWVFFGLVMLLLFYVGSFWNEASMNSTVAHAHNAEVVNRPFDFWLSSSLTFCLILFWPLTASALQSRQSVIASIPESVLIHLPSEAGSSPDWNWQPGFKGVMAEKNHFAFVEGELVGIYFANFGDESQGGELVNSQNNLLNQYHRQWREVGNSMVKVAGSGQPFAVEESVINHPVRDLLVMRWYRIDGKNTANRYYAKWLQLQKRLLGDASAELMVVIYTPTPHDDYQRARQRLQKMALSCCE